MNMLDPTTIAGAGNYTKEEVAFYDFVNMQLKMHAKGRGVTQLFNTMVLRMAIQWQGLLLWLNDLYCKWH
jgi:hypothetical protein